MTDPRPTPPPAGVGLFSYARTRCRICGEQGQHRNEPNSTPEHGEFVDGKWVARHPVGTVNGHAIPSATKAAQALGRMIQDPTDEAAKRAFEDAFTEGVSDATRGNGSASSEPVPGASGGAPSAAIIDSIREREAASPSTTPGEPPYTRERQLRDQLEMSRAENARWRELVIAMLVGAEWIDGEVAERMPSDHLRLGLQQFFDSVSDLKQARADRDRWAERVKLLEAQIRASVDMFEGRRKP